MTESAPANPNTATNRSVNWQAPTALLEQLDQVCDERLVGRNLVITRAVESFISRLLPVNADLAAAPDTDDSTGNFPGVAGPRRMIRDDPQA